MKLPGWLVESLADHYVSMTTKHPDFIIGPADDVYLSRWHLLRSPVCGVYLHVIERSDNDVPHDHPWPSISIVLEGSYIEHTGPMDGAKARRYEAGHVIFRRAKTPHRLEIEPGKYALTLFFTGPRIRRWGFHCPKGWRYYKDFVAPLDDGNVSRIGRGCE